MEKQSQDELKEVAAQLRIPAGEHGSHMAQLMNLGNASMNMHTLAVVNPQANDSILEIGMANCFFVPNILNLHPSITYTGLDYSELMVEESIANNISYVHSHRAQFVCGNIEKMPFDKARFNTVFTINTIYFWEKPSVAMAELKRVLKPGGHVIISFRPKHNMEAMPVTQFGFTKYTIQEVIELLTEGGFVNLQTTEIKEPEKFGLSDELVRESVMIKGQLPN